MRGVKKKDRLIRDLFGFTGDKQVDRIIRYIELTDEECVKKGMSGNEFASFRAFLPRYPYTAILLSYDFGCARGYRAGRRKAGKNEYRN